MNKSLTKLFEADIVLKEDTSTEEPTIILAYNENLKNANYVKIEGDLNRYYYTGDYTRSQQRVFIPCSVDALMSFKDEIKKCYAIISRAESSQYANRYLQDAIPVSTRKLTATLPFDNILPKTALYNVLISMGDG